MKLLFLMNESLLTVINLVVKVKIIRQIKMTLKKALRNTSLVQEKERD